MATTNKAFIAKNGISTGDGYAMPDVRPSLLLDFANSKTLDPRITFTRGSTATYWDGHTTTKAEENLLLNSNGTSTTVANASKSTGQSAPDGGSDAVKLVVDTANDRHIVYQYSSASTSLSGVEFTISVYLKEAGYDYAQLAYFVDGGGASAGMIVNLTNGTVETTNGSPTSTSVTSVGNGWYRAELTDTRSYSSGIGIIVAASSVANPTYNSGSPLFTGDGTSGVIYWGMQLEARSSATALTKTTSSPIVKYQPTLQTAASGEARFDHDPVTGESKGLLIEEARTNLQTYSETFDAGWSRVRLETVEANVIVAPDGTLTGDKYIQEDGLSNYGNLNKTIALTNGTTYTSSVYAKAGQYDGIGLFENNVDSTVRTTYFNLTNGTLISQASAHDSYTITDVGNGWYRFSITFTAVNTASNLIGFYLYDTAGSTGNGYDGNYIWGAQLEVGAFPTSYIPTSGSTVTRSVDVAQINSGSSFTSWYSYGEATIFAEYAKFGSTDATTNYHLFCINKDEGYSGGSVVMRIQGSSNKTQCFLGLTWADEGVVYGSDLDAYGTSTSRNKAVFSYSIEDGATLADSDGALTTDAITSVSPIVNNMKIGVGPSATQPLNGHIYKIAYYPQRLSNATLQAMTEA